MAFVLKGEIEIDGSKAAAGLRGVQKEVSSLSISGQKASAVFKNFSRSLAEARNASDVASSAAASLGQVVGKSLVGAVAIGAVKIFTDQITRMGEILKETATNAQKSFDDIEKAGQAMNLSEAIAQTSALDANITSINNKLAELNRSPFQNFIAGATGARTELEALLKSEQRLRDFKLAEGITTQNINDERLAGLTEEEKQLDAITEEYKKRNKIAETITDPAARAQFQEASGEIYARDRNAMLDKQAKVRADKEAAYQKELFQAEMAASKFERETKEKADKEIADKRKADEEAAHKEAIFNIEEEARLEANAEKTKFEREIRNAKNALEEKKRVQQTALGSEGDILGASAAGRQALDVARKRREQQLKTENFKTAEAIAPTQRDREKMAAQQVAGEMPSLAERIQGGISGVDPSQLARMGALSKFEKDRSFPKGGATETAVGHLGYEKSSLSNETLQAIMKLVELMQSGTVVK
jgi:colicin import membrane protein